MSSGYYPSAQYPLASCRPDGLNLLSLSTQLSLFLHASMVQGVVLGFFNKILNNHKIRLTELAEIST
ncbi:MAG: hypothetical protein EOO68_09120 [Moraxellaceae bacterium]|nr:MAG: hypothetical protein EOO68_09120 [Moraxellaceae bacterium]